MRIAVPREVKDNEFRVAITPAGVHELVSRGHEVVIEQDAGMGSAIPDEDFKSAGAQILSDAASVWGGADLLLKVKEPIAQEYGFLRRDLTLFTYLHLAASAPCTEALLSGGTTSIAYETVRTPDGKLPLLAPMSEVAGRLAPQVGAYHLMRSAGGRGVLMGGVPGAPGAHVVVIGAGVSGQNATAIAVGMGARVTVLDKDADKLRDLDFRYHGRVQTVYSTAYALEQAVLDADLVIGAVLVPGRGRPGWCQRAGRPDEEGRRAGGHRHRPGRLLRGLAADHARRPDLPGARHRVYCVANMPGAVRTPPPTR